MDYRSTVEDPHWRAEELQWARILATGDSTKGMVLLLMQKLCTAFHEFAPAYEAGLVDPAATPFFRQRLGKRAKTVVEAMRVNGLDALEVHNGLVSLMGEVETAASPGRLAELAENVHQLGHRLCDALESEG